MRNAEFVRLHAWGASSRDLFSISSESSQTLALAASSAMSDADFQALESQLRTRNVDVISAYDADYPEVFRNLAHRPFLLYVRGKLPSTNLSISVVGTRKPTAYGLSITERFVSDFVRNGFAVVSGGAYGIDSAAHRSAISSGGVTVAFVGTGIDSDYPKSNRKLFDEIVEGGGAVVSAFPPGSLPLPHHFPIRNALVAAFSRGTLVVEAAAKSGSLITARNSLEFGREVFAIPGDVGRPTSYGPNSLLREGVAKCVLDPSDVYSEFWWTQIPSIGSRNVASGEADSPNLRTGPLSSLADRARRTLASLGTSDPDTLSVSLSEPADRISAALAELEIAGLATSDLFGSYRLR